ncbi:glyoxalase/bleomycin resistance/extradiol dioxygenase family protein [Paenibacillus mucilaginosus]|nr:Glyoxalase/bleomycin resistance protein/dioxygenase [Paenibacillus mucilaginosus KNP414]WFA19256.1 glyoxalase/bleomycin resistance/extradiol dioxygenase family protein [Paenibacillus mucilaginosus]
MYVKWIQTMKKGDDSMKINSFYPVLMTDRVADTAAFYMNYFGFEPVFEADWYVSLRSAGGSLPFELAILDADHSTVPAAYRGGVKGLLLNLEVDHVDAEYDRLILTHKLPLVQDIRSEEFGQRHFITCDPNGVLIDIITVIPPSGDFREQYAEAVWEGPDHHEEK